MFQMGKMYLLRSPEKGKRFSVSFSKPARAQEFKLRPEVVKLARSSEISGSSMAQLIAAQLVFVRKVFRISVGVASWERKAAKPCSNAT